MDGGFILEFRLISVGRSRSLKSGHGGAANAHPGFGSTGFLGTALIDVLGREGHTIVRLVRPGTGNREVSGAPAKTVRWDPVGGQFDAATAEGADALVHLAGASIADGRWNAARKNLLRASRIEATRHLIGALSKLKQPPRVIVASSAIGYYGDRGMNARGVERPGNDFLAGFAANGNRRVRAGLHSARAW